MRQGEAGCAEVLTGNALRLIHDLILVEPSPARVNPPGGYGVWWVKYSRPVRLFARIGSLRASDLACDDYNLLLRET
jgi:hypothetical protein